MYTKTIYISEGDYRKLSGLIKNVRADKRGAISCLDALDKELSRAMIVFNNDMPEDVVSVGATVSVLDLESKAERTVHVVFPEEADEERDHISILSPLGIALIGEKEGSNVVCTVGHIPKKFRVGKIIAQ